MALAKPKPAGKSPWSEVNQLRSAVGLSVGKPPEGSFTSYDYAKEYKVTPRQAFVHLERFVALGTMCKCKYNHGIDNRLRAFFWLKKGKDVKTS